MTVCNMAIEAGARAGLIGVDQTTLDYLRDRQMGPDPWHIDRAMDYWRTLKSDVGAYYDRTVALHADDVLPMVSWGTSPDMVCTVDGVVPDPADLTDPQRHAGMQRALDYMDLSPGTRITEIPPDKIFIGSCTNARIEDLRKAATVVNGRHVAARIVQALVVPGSGLVKAQAQAEGLDRIFVAAGFEWRAPGCSMCQGMNDERLLAGESCASTSNRNFEACQNAGGQTHLISPVMAAAAAVTGYFVDARALCPLH